MELSKDIHSFLYIYHHIIVGVHYGQTLLPDFPNCLSYTILPEIFTRVLFSLNFAVGVGPQKLSARIFCARENFDRMEFIATACGMTSYML